jgi:hypothetical protein
MATSTQQPISSRTEAAAPSDPEIAELSDQLQRDELDGLRQYLSRTRTSGDWQDRIYVLQQVAPKASIDALDVACTAEPEAVDLILIRCAYYAELSKTMRGTGTADQVSGAQFQNSAACVKAAQDDMARCAQLDAQDPTAYTLLLSPLTIFSQHELQQQIFQKAIAIAPDLVPAHLALTNALSERWGGSHKASVAFARDALTKASPGSDIATCLFWAQTLVRTHFISFDKDPRAGRLYATNPVVTQELNAALDAWLAPPYAVRRSSIPFLRNASGWYRAVLDVDRLDRVIALTGEERKLPTSGSASTPHRSIAGGLINWILTGKS